MTEPTRTVLSHFSGILFVESIFLSLFWCIAVNILYPELPIPLAMFAIYPIFFFIFKAMFELWLLLLLFRPNLIKSKIGNTNYIIRRGVGSIFIMVILIPIYIFGSNPTDMATADIRHLSPLAYLYPLSLIASYFVYRNRSIKSWFKAE